jgi:hypothetical protein
MNPSKNSSNLQGSKEQMPKAMGAIYEKYTDKTVRIRVGKLHNNINAALNTNNYNA